MATLSRAALKADQAAKWPNNDTNAITPQRLRQPVIDVVDSVPNIVDDGRTIVRENVADMLSYDWSSIAHKTAVKRLGYNSAGDGGGDDFFVDKSDTTTAENGVTVFVAADGTRLKSVNLFNSVCGTIYTFGDSLTERGYYQTRLESRLGPLWKTVNRGIGGNITADLISRLNSGEVIGNTGANYCIVWCGVNDAISNIAPSTIKANLQSIYTDLTNAGFYVVALTIAPYKDSPYYSSGGQAIVDDVNAWILSTATNVHVKVDTYPILEDPANPDKLLPAYDIGDHIHHSVDGASAVADAIYSSVTWTIPVRSAMVRVSNDANVYINQSIGTGDRVKHKSLVLDAGSLSSPALVITPGPQSMALVPGAIEIATTRLSYVTNETVPQRYELATTSDLPGNTPRFDRVSVGPTPLSYPLSVFKDDSMSFVYKRTGVSAKAWGFQSDNDFTYFGNVDDAIIALKIGNAGNLALPAYGAGTLTTDASGNVTASSDARLKDIDGDFERGLSEILKITPKLYHWRKDSGLDSCEQYAGFIAQDVAGAIPEAVSVGNGEMLTLSDRPIIAALVNAVKELSARLEVLESTV